VVRTVGRTAVVAGTASAVAGGVHRHQSKKWNEKEQAAANQQQAAYDQGAADAQAAAQPAPAPAVDDQTAQIQKLATMHSQGLLTDEEFASAKAKALGI
jgi:hypothetical protein